MTQRAISINSFETDRMVFLAGAKPSFIVTQPGVTTITNDATLTMKVYKGSTDVSSTYTTGSMSVSGNKVTTKTLQNLKGGDELYVSVWGTLDGVYDCICAFWINVQKINGKN